MFVDVEKFPGRPAAPAGIVAIGPAVTFRVPLPAHGKARPRFDPATGRVYDPASNREFERAVGAISRAAMAGREPFGPRTPILAALHIAVAPPERWNATNRAAALRGDSLPPLLVPDTDNVCKSIADAANRIVYADDRQIVGWLISREWAPEHAMTCRFAPIRRQSMTALNAVEWLDGITCPGTGE